MEIKIISVYYQQLDRGKMTVIFKRRDVYETQEGIMNQSQIKYKLMVMKYVYCARQFKLSYLG